jgi:hypothetical protein
MTSLLHLVDGGRGSWRRPSVSSSFVLFLFLTTQVHESGENGKEGDEGDEGGDDVEGGKDGND